MSTSRDVQYIRGYHEYIGDVQYIGVFNRNLKDFINLLPHMHHNILPMNIIISCIMHHNIPHMHHDTPPMS